MPGLKGEKKESKGIDNIKSMMASRENTAVNDAEEERPQEIDKSLSSAGTSKLYEKAFAAVGSTIRKKYEAGKMPLLHEVLFRNIVSAMGGEKKAPVILTPILEKMEIGRTSSTRILACLEHYGYLRLRRIEGVRGKKIEFEISRDVDR